MKNRLPRLLRSLLILMPVILVACSDNNFRIAEPTEPEEQGELIEVPITLSGGDFVVTVDSRGKTLAENPETASADEMRISNFWIFQYDASGNRLTDPRYYTVPSTYDPFRPVAMSVSLQATSSPSTIYVVTNTGSTTWANSANKSKFNTMSALEAMDVPNSLAQEGETISLPMSGSVTLPRVSSSSTIVVPVERLFAKLKIKVNIKKDTDKWEYKNINVQNIPSSCPVATRKVDGSNAIADYGTANSWYTRSHTRQSGEPDDYDYILYVPENIQGIKVGNTQQTKTENAPTHAMNVYVEIKYLEGAKDNDFTVCPGGNNYDDYNVERNHVYLIDLGITRPERGAEDVPSANCIVVPPGTEGVFQPYCCAEVGSIGTEYDDGLDRYDIHTYITPDDPQKKIDHFKVIWQTENVIGDNTAGDKICLVMNEYNEEPEEMEVRSTVYRYNADTKTKTSTTTGTLTNNNVTKTIWEARVKTIQEGNAVIGAYNADDTLLWSWHIWSTGLEPDNIGNAQVYTTFEWDNSGIDSSHRVPGYGIMPCNLGATSWVPDATRDAAYPFHPTRGMVYQWGRKDPFPLLNYSKTNGFDYPNYEYGVVVPLYDNSYTRITKITNYDQQINNPDGYVFYSLSGTRVKGELAGRAQALKYTILHPTCFLCGVPGAGADYNKDIVLKECNYLMDIMEGDWTPDHDNKLWGGLEPDDDTMKHLAINASTGNVIYDNYGDSKSIFDPCPKGWRVSPPDLWLEFSKTGYNPSSSNGVNYQTAPKGGAYMYLTAWKSGETSFFPLPGSRRPDGRVTCTSRCGNYHNATAAKNNVVNCMHVHENADYRYMRIFEDTYRCYSSKSLAGPIRCVRDRK